MLVPKRFSTSTRRKTTTKKKRTPDPDEIVRALREIRADVAELRRIFERVRARLDAQAQRGQPDG
jgi:hypothetical protein